MFYSQYDPRKRTIVLLDTALRPSPIGAGVPNSFRLGDELSISAERQYAYPDPIPFSRPERVSVFSAILNTSC